MKAKRFFFVSGLGIGIAALIFCIAAFERVSDAVFAFTPNLPAGLHWSMVQSSLMQSALLAGSCLSGDYSVETKTQLVPLLYVSNPARARRLANEALSQTMSGESPPFRYHALVALATISRKDKNYTAAQNYLREALHPGGKEWVALQDQGMFATLELAELAKDQKQFGTAERYYDELLQSAYTMFIEGPSQETVQYLLAKKAELKEAEGRLTEANNLRRRVSAINVALSAHTISDEEAPFIDAARKLLAKQESSAPPQEKQQVPAAKPKPPSKELIAELRALRFPGIGHIADGPKTVGDQADGIRYESYNVREEVVPFTPYGPVDPNVEIPLGKGCYVALDGGNYYSFNAQDEQMTLAKNGKIETFEVKTPQVCWGCKSVVIDEPAGTWLALSDEGVHPVLFASPRNSRDQWEPVADLKLQGVESPCGMFFTKERKLYVFDRDTEQRITAIVRLSTDGTVLQRTKFQSPIPLQDEFNFGIVPFGDKIALIEPQTQFVNENGESAIGGAWIVNFKGELLAEIAFDQHEEKNIDPQEVSFRTDAAP